MDSPTTKTNTMTLLKTLKTNWRDIVVGVSLTLAIALIADVAERLSATQDGFTWLANVTGILGGFSRLAAANLAGWLIFAVSWPTLNRYSNNSFKIGWDGLDGTQQFLCFVAVACVQLIASALVFAA